jgi:hypothetical protein
MIGEGLMRIGAMTKEQVDDVLSRKKTDTRVFGQIAIELGYVDDETIKQYLESKST